MNNPLLILSTHDLGTQIKGLHRSVSEKINYVTIQKNPFFKTFKTLKLLWFVEFCQLTPLGLCTWILSAGLQLHWQPTVRHSLNDTFGAVIQYRFYISEMGC